MDIKQEIAELKAKLVKLEAKSNEPLDCYFGNGWYITEQGEIDGPSRALNDNDYTQIRNKEAAEAVVPLVQIQRALINFKCEHDPVFDFSNIDYAWTCDAVQDLSDIYTLFVTLILQSTPFSTKELAESALDMLKRRNLV